MTVGEHLIKHSPGIDYQPHTVCVYQAHLTSHMHYVQKTTKGGSESKGTVHSFGHYLLHTPQHYDWCKMINMSILLMS